MWQGQGGRTQIKRKGTRACGTAWLTWRVKPVELLGFSPRLWGLGAIGQDQQNSAKAPGSLEQLASLFGALLLASSSGTQSSAGKQLLCLPGSPVSWTLVRH